MKPVIVRSATEDAGNKRLLHLNPVSLKIQKLNLHQTTADGSRTLHTDLFTCMKTKPELEQEPVPQPKSCPWWCYFNRRDLWMKDNMIDFYLYCWVEASSEGHTLVSPFSLMNIQHFVVIICCWHSNYSEDCGCLFGARLVEHRKSRNMWCWRKNTLNTLYILSFCTQI